MCCPLCPGLITNLSSPRTRRGGGRANQPSLKPDRLMAHGTEHHLEEAHHAEHARHDPFDRRVAMTMAIVAAALACVTMLSHRAHNETLKNTTEAANQWAYFQAKKN